MRNLFLTYSGFNGLSFSREILTNLDFLSKLSTMGSYCWKIFLLLFSRKGRWMSGLLMRWMRVLLGCLKMLLRVLLTCLTPGTRNSFLPSPSACFPTVCINQSLRNLLGELMGKSMWVLRGEGESCVLNVTEEQSE